MSAPKIRSDESFLIRLAAAESMRLYDPAEGNMFPAGILNIRDQRYRIYER